MANLVEKKKSLNKRDKVFQVANKKLPSFAKEIAGLEENSSDWNFEKAAHLLRRTTIGPTYDEIKKSVELEGLGCDHDLETNQWILYQKGINDKPSQVVERYRY